ncbi:Low temperature viability protein [Basidiobolus meristosporus CBS 931.73]|uniref:Low temperature viability protein n=1 Tax=Basidiobolus meristosporus CBS 931.73 TaxID=1314790 RepID=A0A1Y1ZDV5_9FUNG|nr:Low temperature viability protein [Basidiobolus meristosporus CBS 931.73]|eukprot:ORY08399.1 Low temperature viability protein [Basidiobolus meristosporus CBS 931.73]
MGKKQFIDRKNARHFEVVHRSQRDPLAGDGDSSSRVLREVVPLNVAKKENKEERRLEAQEGNKEDLEERIGQAALYGIYYDDSKYDYTQHLRPIGENPDAVFVAAPKKQEKTRHTGIQFVDDDVASVSSRRERKVTFDLPQDALPSEYELSTGVMNQSALPEDLQGLQPDMDPELRAVLEALDDEDGIDDGDLDEDFIQSLDAEGGEEYGDDYADYDDEEYEEDTTGWANIRRYMGAKYDSDDEYEEDTRTNFTMSSSVMFRNDKLTLLDEQFDKVEKEYEESETESESDSERPEREDLDDILDEFLDKYELVGKKMVPKLEGDSEEKLEAMRKAFLEVSLEEKKQQMNAPPKYEKDSTPMLMPVASRAEREREMWDCESILSTYSNLDNHPSLIREEPKRRIKFDKNGFPVVEVPKQQAEEEENEEEEEDTAEKINKGVPRSKKETPEEKKARKAAIKEERKNRRSEKKQSKSLHKEQQSLRQRVLDQRAKSLATLHLD